MARHPEMGEVEVEDEETRVSAEGFDAWLADGLGKLAKGKLEERSRGLELSRAAWALAHEDAKIEAERGVPLAHGIREEAASAVLAQWWKWRFNQTAHWDKTLLTQQSSLTPGELAAKAGATRTALAPPKPKPTP